MVLLAAVLHATWNALVKSGADRLVGGTVVVGTASVLAAFLVGFVPLPARAAWPYLAFSIVAHTAYYLFLVRGYDHGDLSQVYPFARGVAPMLVALLAFPLAGESLGAVQLGGVALASAGIVSLAFARREAGSHVALGYAGLTGIFIAGYTLIDGLGVRHAGTPSGYIVWLMLLSGLPLSVYVIVRHPRRLASFGAPAWIRSVAGGWIAFVGYGIVVWAMSRSGLAHVAALRETSVIIAALIGTLALGETGLGRRVGAAICVAVGNALLHIF